MSNLKKSLVSFGTNKSQSYKYSVEDRVFRVSDSGPIVVKRKLHNGLYFLHSSTIVGDTIVSSCLVFAKSITASVLCQVLII